jgi:hypothetical protein
MKSRVLGAVLVLGSVLLASAVTVMSEGWKPLHITKFARDLKPADVNVAEQTLEQIHKVFLADPVLSTTPTGVLVIPIGTIGYGPSSGVSASSLPFRTDLVTYGIGTTILHPKQYCPNGTNCRLDIGEGPDLHVSVNAPTSALLDRRAYIERPGNPEKWYRAAKKIGEVAGFPLYENGKVIITKTDRPLWIPVTREEFVRAKLDVFRDGPARQKIEQELATLTNPSGPAYCCSSTSKPFSGLAGDEEGTRMIVRLNKDFFDPKLNAGTAQVIMVDTAVSIDVSLGKGYKDRPLIENFVNKLDWQGLAPLVK